MDNEDIGKLVYVRGFITPGVVLGVEDVFKHGIKQGSWLKVGYGDVYIYAFSVDCIVDKSLPKKYPPILLQQLEEVFFWHGQKMVKKWTLLDMDETNKNAAESYKQ